VAARLLIIEDEEPLTMSLRYNFEVEAYEVDVAERGDEAKIKLRENPFRSRHSRLDVASAFGNLTVPAAARPA
jgi:DNA-binding response OmpR family regulator